MNAFIDVCVLGGVRTWWCSWVCIRICCEGCVVHKQMGGCWNWCIWHVLHSKCRPVWPVSERWQVIGICHCTCIYSYYFCEFWVDHRMHYLYGMWFGYWCSWKDLWSFLSLGCACEGGPFFGGWKVYYYVNVVKLCLSYLCIKLSPSPIWCSNAIQWGQQTQHHHHLYWVHNILTTIFKHIL